MSELTFTKPAADMFAAVIDTFHAATAPGVASSLPSLTLGGGEGGFSFSFGGGATAATDGGAAPSGGEGGGSAAPAAPSAD